jgi:plasmid maintenance system antidote protein VapI
MENTSELPAVDDRDIFYYQRRNQNRIFETLTSFFADEAERRGITKKDVADAIRRDPASITRLLSTPSNITADTISSFLLGLGAEMDYRIVRFNDRPRANEMHPLIAQVVNALTPKPAVNASKNFKVFSKTSSNASSTELSVE